MKRFLRSAASVACLSFTLAGVVAAGAASLDAQGPGGSEDQLLVDLPQDPAAYSHTFAPVVRAFRLDGSIAVDGSLSEPAWDAAPPITEFLQIVPVEGAPASERTEVRILYDDEAVYVGARLEDRSRVTTRLARRDAGLGDTDGFVVLFDSFHDHETAYRFWTNPSGIKGDAIVTGNSTGGGDSSWDPVWEVATQVTETGWSVEMRIPFSQLRFSPAEEQVWGIQIERRINRNQENAVFPFTPTVERAGVARFAHMEGITGIRPGRRLELLPYIAARGEYLQLGSPAGVGFKNPYRSGSDHFGEMGLDLKYRLTSNVTLDATFNPDFGQVDLDPSVINLTAFETRFDERRPFFVEGADIFSFGEMGPMGSVGTSPDILFSRRIGIPPRGAVPSAAVFSDVPTQTTILGATKITGRLEGGWSLGLLQAVTGRETASYVDADAVGHEIMVEPAANYLVGRLRRQISGGRTRFGAIASAVNRDPGLLASRLHSAAYATGIDFAHESPDRIWLFTGSVAASHVRGDSLAIRATQLSSRRYFQRPDANHVELDRFAELLSGYSLMGYLGKQAGRFTMRNGVALISPGFEVNDLGFHNNADRILFDTHYQWTHREPGRFLRSWSFFGGPDAVWNTAGDMTFMNVNVMASLELLNYWRISSRFQWDSWTVDDRLTRGGPIARNPGGLSGNLNINSDGRRSTTVGMNFSWAERSTESWTRSVRFNVNSRFDEAVQLRLSPSFSRSYSDAQFITARSDPFAEDTYGSRYVFAGLDQRTLSMEVGLNVAFSPALTLQLYAEPFISTGDFGALKEFRAPRTYEFLEYGTDIGTVVVNGDGSYSIDPDGEGPAIGFVIPDRDFSVRSLLGNAVLRYEWRAGSTVYLVWQQRRIDSVAGHQGGTIGAGRAGVFDFSRDLGDMFSVKPDNIMMIKVSYWLNP